jgi:hypothetical protein
MFSRPLPHTLGPSSRNVTKPFFATLLFTGLLGKEKSEVKATSNCGHIRIQVRSSLFGVCRIQLGIAGKAFPLQDSAISLYRHRCQTSNGEAFRPNDRLAKKGGPIGYGRGDAEPDSAIGFGPGDFDSHIRALPS